MSTEEKPDLDKFMTDPRFQKDRDFFEGMTQKILEKKAAEARAKAQPDQGSIFDFLFWRPKDDGDDNVFDRWFGGRK